MCKKTNIILLGFMGTGKTTVGRQVAQQLGKTFVDMDALIEEREDRTISSIFEKEGESHFRNLERTLVEELSEQSEQVIATGGGVILDTRNVATFSTTGIPICLLASPEAILRRVSVETHRPLLEGGDKANKILALLSARRTLYESMPQQVDTTDRSPAEVVAQVVALFRSESDA